MLARTCEIIEYGGLAGVWISGQGNGNLFFFHFSSDSNFSIITWAASSTRNETW